MKPESILQALGEARPEYLALPQKTGPRAARPLGRILLIAAAVALLATTAFGAVTGVRYLVKQWTKDAPISERKLADNWFELYFENNPAADDAPETLAELYLPAAPEGYLREHTALSYGNAFETENTVVWELGDPWAELDEKLDAWTAAHPLLTGDELAAWEQEHPAPTVRIETVQFSQKPLKALRDRNVFATFGAEAAGELTKSGEIVGQTEYVVYTCTPEDSDSGSGGTWYFWLDEQRHYIFCLSFTDGIPQADRETFLRSVKSVDRETYLTRTGIEDWNVNNRNNERENRGRLARGEKLLPVYSLYVSDFAPEGFDASTCLVIGDETAPLSYMQEWQDGKGHSASLLLGWTMDDDDFADWTHTTRSLGGTEVDIWVSSQREDSDDSTWREEFWRWTAPDGETVLFLYFFSADNTEPEDAFKLSLFWSVREGTPEQQVRIEN